ncbi:MAG: flagellar hook-associated protein FlgK [Austwickia sp.]|nr:flagellar hook-associated protein FlgK [Austwickia sp.]
MSSFGSLNLGARAIFAAQRGLDITGQNIANSATPGYSRQRVDQVAVGGPTVPAIWSKYDQTGGGVKVTGISRMRDEFLEARARVAHQNLGELDERTKTLEGIERTIGEPSDTGLKQRMAEFWQSWAAAGNDLKSEGPRRVVVEKGKAVADELNRQATTLEVQWTDTRTELAANVTDVNKAAGDIATLNRAIRNNVINGLPANELADQRDLLVEKVTTLTGGVAERAEDGVVNVKVGEVYLVNGRQHRDLQALGATDALSFRTTDPTAIDVQWGKLYDLTDEVANDPGVTSGSALPLGPKSTMAAQTKALNETLPKYLEQLDDIANTMATAVNEQNAKGWTIDGTEDGRLGPELFVSADATAPLAGARGAVNLRFTGEAKDLGISAATKTDATGATVAVPPPLLAGGVPGVINGDNAKVMSAKMGVQGGADDKLRGMVVTLGVEAASVYRNQKAAANVAKTADDARESVSGVSLNEEMTNLMKYQHSFEAAAKFITSVDATIESLLNMTR